MTYSEALEEMKEGAIVTRPDFEKDYCFKIVPGVVNKAKFERFGLHNMISTDLFFDISEVDIEEEEFYPYIVCLNSRGDMYKGWLLNDIDILSHDWKTINEEVLISWGHEEYVL